MRAFISEQKVPDIASPVCPCGISQETSAHIAAYCLREEASRRGLLLAHQSCLPGAVVHEEEEDMGGYREALQNAENEDQATIPPPTCI